MTVCFGSLIQLLVILTDLPSPRLGGCVYVLAYMPPGIFPLVLGTAWAVECQSATLLVTARHIMDSNSTQVPYEELVRHLFIMKSVQVNDDGTTTVAGSISVSAVTGDGVSDVAVLKAATPLPAAIPLCPIGQFPSTDNEDRVKTYHVPCQNFGSDCPVVSVQATVFNKIFMESKHHYFIVGENTHGSPGGVVVDEMGRAVAMVCSGYVPGVVLPLPNDFNTEWDRLSALPHDTSTFTRCVKFDVVPDLYSYVALH
jgi:hypothetical protein